MGRGMGWPLLPAAPIGLGRRTVAKGGSAEPADTAGVLKYQTNLEEHPPGCFHPNTTLREDIPVPGTFEEPFPEYAPEPFPAELEPFAQNNFVRICAEEPKFQSHFPETWLWISGPLCLYCAERLYRYIRSYKPATITSVISHPSNVLELRMRKENFKARPGQLSPGGDIRLIPPSFTSLQLSLALWLQLFRSDSQQASPSASLSFQSSPALSGCGSLP
ncbi:NADPH oxidase 4 [Chelonia mydas]|uniref:NADPH oxidase 4 n=1 Tax=Chelonia mydas TaxID=8469 RepID=M7BAR2_CHEMY|nr:NADPH oxidase 4 [Chelonia mydas]